jgi:hypothetical protein
MGEANIGAEPLFPPQDLDGERDFGLIEGIERVNGCDGSKLSLRLHNRIDLGEGWYKGWCEAMADYGRSGLTS